jgi:hypothetical protein
MNFWRRYLLVTPDGHARTFNPGAYGTEQMNSLMSV